MDLMLHSDIKTDVLVIGSGSAGLRAAIEARKHGVNVLMVSKSRIGLGNNTAMSAGGIAAGTGWREPADSPEVHFKDTIIAGRHINNQGLVDIMTREIGREVLNLQGFGVKFRKKGEAFHVVQMAGHTHPRNVFADNNIGIGLTLPLRDYAAGLGVQLTEGVLITKLLTTQNAVAGAMGVDEAGGVHIYNAKSTILAMGGAGHIYLRTSNARGSTGDGFVLAYDTGVPIIDMEFVQYISSGPNIEIFCAREGAVLRNSLGENVLEKYNISDPNKMTWDVVCQAIMTEILEGRSLDGTNLVLDTTPISDKRFGVLRALLPRETPADKRRFSIGLHTHVFNGGAKINGNAETNIDRLYAAGEDCGGIKGASVLSGNNLAAAFVSGKIAGKKAAQGALAGEAGSVNAKEISTEMERLRALTSGDGESIEEVQGLLNTTMWNKAGVIRNGKGLEEALEEVSYLKGHFRKVTIRNYRELTKAIKLGNMLVVSEMVARAALLRTESRGAHYRSDWRQENNREWLKNITISKKNGEMVLSTTPVDLSRMAPDL